MGESPAETIAREVYEESGYRVRVTRLLSAYDRDRHGHPPSLYYVYKLVFLGEVLDHDPSVAAEADAVGFFAADAVPPLSLPRVTPAQIERFFEHHRNPNLPADFDKRSYRKLWARASSLTKKHPVYGGSQCLESCGFGFSAASRASIVR